VAPLHESLMKRQTALHDIARIAPPARRVPYCLLVGMAVPLLTLLACSSYIDPHVPEPIRPFADPVLARKYLLYRPSEYDVDHNWPLVVVCHGSWPDSPVHRLRQWTQLAEEKGFLVIAPQLEATGGGGGASQISKLKKDEMHILAAVGHVRGAHSISPDRIFIQGRSGGAHDALFTGLNNPDVFRAIALVRPEFDSACMTEATGVLDHYQPILILDDSGGPFAGKDARRATEWLQEQAANVSRLKGKPSGGGAARAVVEFFERVLRRQPWIRIHAFPFSPEDPLQIQFKTQRSFQPIRFLWSFGDGDESPVASPVHQYAAPGTYRVSLKVWDESGQQYVRRAEVEVPDVLVRSLPPSAAPKSDRSE
jgi:pimeloyl-ACP methyl ester carboxylesterase